MKNLIDSNKTHDRSNILPWIIFLFFEGIFIIMTNEKVSKQESI